MDGKERGRNFKRRGPKNNPSFSPSSSSSVNSEPTLFPKYPRGNHIPERWARSPNENSSSQEVNRKPPFSRKPGGFGFRRLDALCKLQSVQIMQIFTNENTLSEFSALATQADLKGDFIVRIVLILGKLSRAEFEKIVAQSLSQISTSVFLNHLLNHIFKYDDEELEETAYQDAYDFFDNLTAYCHAVIKLLPTLASEKLMPIVKQSKCVLDSLYFDNVERVKEVAGINFEKLTAEKDKRKTQTVKKTIEEEAVHYSSPPENFRELSTVPMTNDLLRARCSYLRPAITSGPYTNVDHYLDVQFRLIREDFIRPLRDGIKEYIQKKAEAANSTGKGRRIKVNNIKMYQEVMIGRAEIVEDKVGLYVSFDPQNRFCTTINWEQSKRFMHGSLLILTRNDFESIVLAKVLKRHVEDLKKGQVLAEIMDPDIDFSIFQTRWTMAESQLFFGAYSHVLDALKKFDELNFPLKQYIVKGQNDTQMPEYLANTLSLNLPVPDILQTTVEEGEEGVETAHLKVNPHDNGSWPSAANLGLDESQYEAFKGALTQKVMLVQGPPGTGKTYLGLRIASVLLHNSDIWQQDMASKRPLIVVCYTNHALDQFLMGLTPFTDSIVRVGGGSKEKSLDKYSIRNLRSNRNFYRGGHLTSMLRNYREKFDRLKSHYQSYQAARALIESGCGIVDPECFYNFGVMSQDELYCFQGRPDFMNWLEGSFNMKGGHTVNKLQFSESIYQDVNSDGLEDIYFIASFSKIDEIAKQSKDFACRYSQMLKSHLESQLNSPTTKPEGLDFNLLGKVRSLKQLPESTRWQLYRTWVIGLLKVLNKKSSDLQLDLLKAAGDLKSARDVEEQAVMATCKVIGMTTSYAASRQAILKQLQPRIVIVEEAAEVLEAHVIVSLTGSVEHLIMIGDHLQLKPNPAVYELATKYHLNVSLFERLINNKVQCVSLTTQHRMRPEIAKLVCPTIYPLLINHSSVFTYPQVKGVNQNVAFIQHKFHQETVEEIQSFRNVHEAEFISSMVKYLRLQGYKASQITVLATYKGQMFYMHKLRQDNSFLQDIRITVVDNYQGEESDIILLSLVRSNDDGEVGFLKIENRVCVALSRAKHGLFIIGNMSNLVSKGEIWTKVSKELQDQNGLVDALELRCEVHSVITPVSCSKDFVKVPEGGCSSQCGTLMKCGHTCLQMCHATDREHLQFQCFERCTRPLCIKNHICPKKCHEPCGPCMVPFDVRLPCGHPATIPCYVEPSQYNCLEIVNCELDPCHHFKDVLCHEKKKPREIRCSEPCTIRLACGHSCVKRCHLLDDPDHESYKCTKPCDHKNLGCSTGEHICKKACHQDCEDCVVMVKKVLPCGHNWTMKCNEEPSRKLCGNRCTLMNECNHKCLKKCKDNCSPCVTEIEKTIPRCGHLQKMLCGLDPSDFKHCEAKCERTLPCGHICTKLCFDNCETECRKMIQYGRPAACGHTILVPCFQRLILDFDSEELLMMCQNPCNALLEPCKHHCKGTCGSCWQGRLHRACDEPCGRVLVCGHSCKAPCASLCPPCGAPCSVMCQHSRCPNRCGEPCAPCKEPCPRKCPHKKCNRKCGQKCNVQACQKHCNKILNKCKHKCIGLCGDGCICEECNAGIRDVFLGSEDEDKARFVKLVDCQHIFESTDLEQWLLQDSELIEQGSVSVKEKVCPMCKTPIRKTLRYSEIIMNHTNDVQAVKRKVFGNINEITRTASKASSILPNFNSIPKGFGELVGLRNILDQKLSSILPKQQRRKSWNQPKASAAEVQNLLEYCRVVVRMNTVVKKALGPEVPTRFTVKSIRDQSLSSDHKLNEKSLNEMTNLVKKIASNLRARNVVRLGIQEAKDIANVCCMLEMRLQLCFIESSPNFSSLSSALKGKHMDVSTRVRGPHRYLDSEYASDCKVLKTLAEEVKAVITQAEKRAIVVAMGMGAGHWFKCPNGHLYAIGDCGGATMESKCNECGAKIGGGSHRLRTDNSFAPEMDGALAPAWPGTAMAP